MKRHYQSASIVVRHLSDPDFSVAFDQLICKELVLVSSSLLLINPQEEVKGSALNEPAPSSLVEVPPCLSQANINVSALFLILFLVLLLTMFVSRQ